MISKVIKGPKRSYYIKYDLKGHPSHIRPPLCQNHSSTFGYGPNLIKICMNANIIKTQFFH